MSPISPRMAAANTAPIPEMEVRCGDLLQIGSDALLQVGHLFPEEANLSQQDLKLDG